MLEREELGVWRMPSISELDDMLFTSDVWSLFPLSPSIFVNGAKIKVIKGTTEKLTRMVRDILAAFDPCNQTYSSSWAKMQQVPIIKHTNPRKLFASLIKLWDERLGTHSAKLPNACNVVVWRFFLDGSSK